MATANPQEFIEYLDYDDGNCPICFTSPQLSKSRLPCGHVYCFECISEWSEVKWECPFCKQRFESFVTSIDQSLADQSMKDREKYSGMPQETLPSTLPDVLNIMIDAESNDMLKLMSNGCQFIRDRIKAHRIVPIDEKNELNLGFIITNAPPDQEFHRAIFRHIEGALSRLREPEEID